MLFFDDHSRFSRFFHILSFDRAPSTAVQKAATLESIILCILSLLLLKHFSGKFSLFSLLSSIFVH